MGKIEITPELLSGLKEKAEKAREYEENEIAILAPKGYVKFVFAANPAVVLALIERIEELEVDADPQALTALGLIYLDREKTLSKKNWRADPGNRAP